MNSRKEWIRGKCMRIGQLKTVIFEGVEWHPLKSKYK